MMNAAAVSLIPNQMIAKGIQASGGIGRNTRASHAWLASTRGNSATDNLTHQQQHDVIRLPESGDGERYASGRQAINGGTER